MPAVLLPAAMLGLLSGCAVRTVDCWQLSGTQLADARASGQCGDAFARNIEELVPFGATAQRATSGTATVARPLEGGVSGKPPAKRKKRS